MVEQPGVLELEPYGYALYRAVIDATAPWITSRVQAIASASVDVNSPEFQTALAEVARRTYRVVQEGLYALLVTDVDAQKSNPLHLVRESTTSATELLRMLAVPPARRDEFEERAMPNDVYAIGPLTWRDLSDDVHDAGISWGAWKAATILMRRRAEGSIP